MRPSREDLPTYVVSKLRASVGIGCLLNYEEGASEMRRGAGR